MENYKSFIAAFILSFGCSMAVANPSASNKEIGITAEKKQTIDRVFTDCRRFNAKHKLWKRAVTSDEDYCSCFKWHMTDLVSRTEKFKVDQIRDQFTAAVQAVEPQTGPGKSLIKDAFTLQHSVWIAEMCEDDPTTKNRFPL